jgi:hypothetical protein
MADHESSLIKRARGNLADVGSSQANSLPNTYA